MNENWPRWFASSIVNHFATETSLKMFVEGEPRDTWEDSDFIECRMDGPIFLQLSPLSWQIKVEVNILIQSTMNREDLYRIHRNVGQVAVAFSKPLIVYRYGDDDTVLTCMQLLQNARTREYLIVSHFGQIAIDKPIYQATVEGHFQTILES